MQHTFHVRQDVDEIGQPEEFTSDSFLILPPTATAHLLDTGLPPIGLAVQPGMVLVGKFGATKTYRKVDLPNDFEILGFNGEDACSLIDKYGHMFHDGSFYVPEDVRGRVAVSEFREIDGVHTAVVIVET